MEGKIMRSQRNQMGQRMQKIRKSHEFLGSDGKNVEGAKFFVIQRGWRGSGG